MWNRKCSKKKTIQLIDGGNTLTSIVKVSEIISINAVDNYSPDFKFGLNIMTVIQKLGMGFKTQDERDKAMRQIASNI